MTFEIYNSKNEKPKQSVKIEIIEGSLIIKIDDDNVVKFYTDGTYKIYDYEESEYKHGVWDSSKSL